MRRVVTTRFPKMKPICYLGIILVTIILVLGIILVVISYIIALESIIFCVVRNVTTVDWWLLTENYDGVTLNSAWVEINPHRNIYVTEKVYGESIYGLVDSKVISSQLALIRSVNKYWVRIQLCTIYNVGREIGSVEFFLSKVKIFRIYA